jgi:hypothetical protein
VLLALGGRGDGNDAVLLLDQHIRMGIHFEIALGALDGDVVALTDGDGYAGRDSISFLPILDITNTPFLPYEGENFAAYVSLSSLLICHNTLRSGNDSDTETIHNSGHILTVGVDTETGLGNSLKTVNYLNLAGSVLESNSDDTLLAVLNDLVVLDVTFLEKDLSDGLLKVGCGNVYRFMLCIISVSNSGEHICNYV